MKLELVDSIDVCDEYEKYYYNNTKDKKISRRRFISVVSFGFMAMFSAEKANSLPYYGSFDNYSGIKYYIGSLIRRDLMKRRGLSAKNADNILNSRVEANIPKINMDSYSISSRYPSSGELYLANNTKKNINGNLEMVMVEEWDIDKFFKSKISKYSIPPNKIQKYRFKNGPSANTENEDIKVSLVAESRIDREKSSPILIRA